MLERLKKTAAIAAFACLLIGFGFAEWQASLHSHQHNADEPTHSENRNGQKGKAVTSETTNPKNNERNDNPRWYREILKPTDWLLVVFTFLLALYTRRLYVATAGLRESSERQIGVAKETADAAKGAAEAAKEANALTREIYIADQRPWLLWSIPNIAAVSTEGRHLTIHINGEIQNIGKTPALNVTYFGKFYSPAKGEAALNQGIAFYAQHLQEALSMQFSLANVLPTEKVPMNFTPHGIEISSLPLNTEFSLCLAFHAKYHGRLGRVAEIGAVYMLQPFEGPGHRPQKITFNVGEFRTIKSVSLVELPGSRRIT